MRKSHRRWHLLMWGLLGPVIAVVIALGLAARAGGADAAAEKPDASVPTKQAEVSP